MAYKLQVAISRLGNSIDTKTSLLMCDAIPCAKTISLSMRSFRRLLKKGIRNWTHEFILKCGDNYDAFRM